MSERQAKKNRKNTETVVSKPKKDKAQVIINIVVTLLVVVLAGAGVWAVWGQFGSDIEINNVSEEATYPTVSEYAQSVDMTVEQFLQEYGLADNTEITGETDMTVATQYMTLGNYLKVAGMDLETFKQSVGFTDEFDKLFNESTLMSEIISYVNMTAELAGQGTESNE